MYNIMGNMEEMMEKQNEKFPWLHLLILSSVTFMGILSELVPSGILPEMSNG